MDTSLKDFNISSQQKEFLLVLGYLYLQNAKFMDAKIVFEALQLIYPKDLHILRSLSYAYLCDGDYEQAIELNEEIKSLNKSDDNLSFYYLLKSKALWRIQKTTEARQNFNEFIAIQNSSL